MKYALTLIAALVLLTGCANPFKKAVAAADVTVEHAMTAWGEHVAAERAKTPPNLLLAERQEVQRIYGRSIINSFHAVWAVGAIFGGLIGAGAIAIHMPRTTQLLIVGAVFSVVVVIAYPYLLRGRDHDDHPAAKWAGGGGPGLAGYATLVALVLIAIAGATVEDSGTSWATLYLRDTLGAPGALAVFGYIALVGFMFVGRLIGDRLVDRFGERAVVRAGGFRLAEGFISPLDLVAIGLVTAEEAKALQAQEAAAEERAGVAAAS